jgi:nucleoid-associated protein YgaU
MRAADQAHSTAINTDGHAAGALFKLLVAVIATLALLTIWRPTVVGAQAAPQPPAEAKPAPAKPTVATGRTHVVKPGETLWGLAARYYGDGHAWQQLARANKIATDGNKPPLEIGMTLQVPVSKKVAGTKAAAVAAAPADSSVPKVALLKAGEGTLPAPPADAKREPKADAAADAKAPAGSLAAQTAGKGNASGKGGTRPAPKTPKEAAAPAASTAPTPSAAPTPAEPESLALQRRQQTLLGREGRVRIGLVSNDDQTASRKSTEVLTVFHRDIPDAAEAERRTKAVLRPNTPVPRQGELDAAPYLVSEAEHAQAPTIAGRVGAPPAELEAYPDRALRSDEIELRAAPKKSFRVGDLLQAYASMPSAVKGRLVAIPTGVVEVTAVRPNGEAVGVVREQSARIEQGQRLAPPAGAPAPRVTAEKLATPDVASTVLWLDPSTTIPTLQSYLLIGAGSAKGVKPGDEFALYHRPKGGNEAQMAVARVVRTGSDFSAAVIVRQSGAEITTGMAARRIAKAP